MGDRTGTTIYFDDYQRVFLDLSDELTMAGATRTAFDQWLEEAKNVDTDELEEATEIIKASDVSVEEIVEDASGLQDFLNQAEELQPQEVNT